MLNCFFFDPVYTAAKGASAPFRSKPTSTVIAAPTAAGTTRVSESCFYLRLVYVVCFVLCSPFSDLSHRKVIQYITGADNKDDLDVGHGMIYIQL